MRKKEAEKLLEKEIKKDSIKLLNVFVDFAINILFTSIVLWIAVNLFFYAFKFQIRITMLQSTALIFALSVLYWIGGRSRK